MKTFVIEEKFVGYADITIEAETEEQAIQIYKDGNYKDSNYNLDEYFYEYEFNSIREKRVMNPISVTHDERYELSNYMIYYRVYGL